MLVEAAEREAFLHFIRLNTALWSIEDSVLTISNDGVVLVDLLSHDVHQLIRALYVGKILQRQFNCRLVGLVGNMMFSKNLGFQYSKQNAVLLAGSYGIVDFLDLEEDLPPSVPTKGFSGSDTDAAIASLAACPDDSLSDFLLSWRAADGCRIGEYIYETALRVARNPFLTHVRDVLYRVTAETHHIHNLVNARCTATPIIAFTSGHMSYTQWGMTADIILRRGGKAVWYDSTGNFSAYLFDRAPTGNETLDSHVRRVDKTLFDEQFKYKDKLDPQFVAKVRLLFSSDFFLRPFWFEPAKSPPAALIPILRKIALRKLGWPDDPKPVVCVFFHCLSDLPRDDEQIYLDYYVWIVETLKIAKRDTTKNWIFKTHPYNRGGYDVTNVTDQLKADWKDCDNIYFLEEELQKMELYSVCDLAVTVRGSISYEMSVFGKPALLAGRSVLSDLGFCFVANTASEYEELLTTKFDTLKLTPEMQERANFYLIYDKILCRLESTFMPYWTYQLTGNSIIWNALCERILYNISDLDPVASAIRKMFQSGPPRTINPRATEITANSPPLVEGTTLASLGELPGIATVALGEIVSLGLGGMGATELLSKPSRVDRSGSWFVSERSASIAFAAPVPAPGDRIALGLHIFIPNSGGSFHLTVNGAPIQGSPYRGSGADVHLVELDPALAATGNIYVIDVSVKRADGRPISFRLDGFQVDVLRNLRRYPDVAPFFGYRIENDRERDFAWMPQEIDLNLAPSTNGKKLQVKGYIPFSMHRDQTGISEFTLDATVGGQHRKSILAKSDEVFTIVIDLQGDAKRTDDPIRVRLRSNSVLPADDEARELSFIVTEFLIE